MNIRNTEHHITRRIKFISCMGALGAALVVALPEVGYAQDVTPPAVPGTLNVPDGNEAFLIGHAFGSQDYACAASSSGVAFVLTTPEAVLFDNPARRVVNHFFSPNPIEGGTVRATWQSTRNSSVFWGKLVHAATFATDPEFVSQDAIAWLLLSRAGVLDGSGNGDNLGVATFVQRVNTVGGLAPSTGCSSPADIGKTAFVPYEADYVFYRTAIPTTATPERR